MQTIPPRRIAVLASGRGSNLAALIEAIAEGRIDGEIVGVFSNRPQAAALDLAREAGIAAWSGRPADFENRESFDRALFSAVADVQPQLIVCAGYLRIIYEAQVCDWIGRMINIHPSLLPDYPGLDTHGRVLADGGTRHGASVHFVTPELDGGPVIAQALIDIREGDTPDSLAERLLPREHALLRAVTAALCAGEIVWHDGQVMHRGEPLLAPLRLGDDDRLHEATQ